DQHINPRILDDREEIRRQPPVREQIEEPLHVRQRHPRRRRLRGFDHIEVCFSVSPSSIRFLPSPARGRGAGGGGFLPRPYGVAFQIRSSVLKHPPLTLELEIERPT